MSYPRKNRWISRMAFGLVLASVLVAGVASVAAATIDLGTRGSHHVKVGNFSGQVDDETGIPVGAGIPHGDEQFIDGQGVAVIPYLSHGILTQEAANALSARSADDPFASDVNVRPGESLGGPDGGPRVTRPVDVVVEPEVANEDGQSDRMWMDRD